MQSLCFKYINFFNSFFLTSYSRNIKKNAQIYFFLNPLSLVLS